MIEKVEFCSCVLATSKAALMVELSDCFIVQQWPGV